MAGEIILGYDGTECAEHALTVAIDLAKGLSEKLLVVYAYDPSRMGGEVRDLDQALEGRGEEVTAKAIESAKAAGVDAEALIAKEKAWAALSELATTRKARFIVVGSYSERPVTGFILGATPHKLLHIADVPVIVVPVRE